MEKNILTDTSLSKHIHTLTLKIKNPE
jgi:hypothetical protein